MIRNKSPRPLSDICKIKSFFYAIKTAFQPDKAINLFIRIFMYSGEFTSLIISPWNRSLRMLRPVIFSLRPLIFYLESGVWWSRFTDVNSLISRVSVSMNTLIILKHHFRVPFIKNNCIKRKNIIRWNITISYRSICEIDIIINTNIKRRIITQLNMFCSGSSP